jgi:hypothetical protein
LFGHSGIKVFALMLGGDTGMSRLCAAAALMVCLCQPAFAVEPFVGRWAVTAEVCSGRGDTAATAALVTTDTSLSWFAGYCRIGKMYKAGEAVYLLVHCSDGGDIPVTLAASGDRMKVTWNRTKPAELRRCK